METKEFKRSTYLTLTPKTAKEGLRLLVQKRKNVNVTHQIMATQVAIGRLTTDLIPMVSPGIQLKAEIVEQTKKNLGNVLHHAVLVAKLLKVKVPASKKAIKARTPTLLLMEIERYGAGLFETFFNSINSGKFVPMTDEERVSAEAKFKAAETKRGEKAASDKVEFKPRNTPAYQKIVTDPVNEELLKSQVEHLLRSVYEFTWAVTHGPVADIMEAHITSLKPNYADGFFTPPPKKPVPAGLKPPQKKKAAEETATPDVAQKPVAKKAPAKAAHA
jgi:hypothetical protein